MQEVIAHAGDSGMGQIPGKLDGGSLRDYRYAINHPVYLLTLRGIGTSGSRVGNPADYSSECRYASS